MPAPDRIHFAQMLGFTSQWFALGIIDDETLAIYKTTWDATDDHNTEHYRYGTFLHFLNKHISLTPALAASLYELGARDPDLQMGGAIMGDILRRPECPRQILGAALLSGREHLIKLVRARLSKSSGTAY